MSESLVKAKLVVHEGSVEGVTFQFNPESYSLSKSSDWKANQGDHKFDLPVQEWKGGSGMKLEITAIFDTTDENKDVRDLTRKAEALTLVDPHKHQPPIVKFDWGGVLKMKQAGSDVEIHWIVTSFNTTYKMFNSDGVPVRAEMKLSLSEYSTEKELKDRAKMQSPDHEKAYRVQPGDTLQSIAWKHYENPTLWRPIAAANHIEDPRDLSPGAVLRVPRIR
jgi:hypothetical protein